jgi:hypothetical protein
MEEEIEIVIKEFALKQLEEEYVYFFKEYSEKYADSFYPKIKVTEILFGAII